MADINVSERKKHELYLYSRSVLNLDSVTDLVSFDENGIVFDLGNETLTVAGSDLSVTKLSLETGDASVKGKIDALVYTDINNKTKTNKKTFLSRMFG